MERATIFVRGEVQGVGFRWWARVQALELGLTGHARNMDDGRVEVVAQGEGDAIDALVALLGEDPSRRGRPGQVTGVVTQWGAARAGVETFVEK